MKGAAPAGLSLFCTLTLRSPSASSLRSATSCLPPHPPCRAPTHPQHAGCTFAANTAAGAGAAGGGADALYLSVQKLYQYQPPLPLELRTSKFSNGDAQPQAPATVCSAAPAGTLTLVPSNGNAIKAAFGLKTCPAAVDGCDDCYVAGA